VASVFYRWRLRLKNADRFFDLADNFHRCIMAKPDALDLFNECLSIVEQTTDDRAAERVLLVAFGFWKWRRNYSPTACQVIEFRTAPMRSLVTEDS
jgi:hypothetical protein